MPQLWYFHAVNFLEESAAQLPGSTSRVVSSSTTCSCATIFFVTFRYLLRSCPNSKPTMCPYTVLLPNNILRHILLPPSELPDLRTNYMLDMAAVNGCLKYVSMTYPPMRL